KADKEVRSLQPLTSSLEKERNELLEKIKEFEARVEEKDNIIENLEERVDMEVEMNLKALDKSKEYHDRNLFLLGMSKDTIITNLKLKIQELEKNQKVDRDARTQIGKKCDDELLFNDVIVDVDDELYSIMRNENNENNEESDYYISDYDFN
ncbi:12790_t:CDS:2, partial [Entrophospora sp. SA101]